MKSLLIFALATGACAPALAFSAGPPARRTGARFDGGLDCTACHRSAAPANRDPRGRIAIEVSSYQPGVKQVIRVIVEHPASIRWGFELTARVANDPNRPAGTFTATELIRVICGATGTPAPCAASDQQFATQNANSNRLGANGRSVWEVEWTPPAADAGDVIFTFAGNAADGGNTSAGDEIYSGSRLVRNAAGCALTGTPAVSGVSNAASGAQGLAFNTLFSVYGAGFLGTDRKREAGEYDFDGARYPTQLDCVALEYGGRRLPISYVQDSQINAQGPTVDGTRDNLVVILNPGTANERRVAAGAQLVNGYQAALFTFNGRSVAAHHTDGVLTSARPARAGDVVTLYATGLGDTVPLWQSGEIAQSATPLAERATVQVGNVTLAAGDVLYAGSAPTAISGLYQLNIRIPAGLDAGDVPLSVRVAGSTSQAGVTIPIAR